MDGHPSDESPDDGTVEPPPSTGGEGEEPPGDDGERSSATAGETHEDPAATAKDRTDDTPPVTANPPTAPEAPTPAPAGSGPSSRDDARPGTASAADDTETLDQPGGADQTVPDRAGPGSDATNGSAGSDATIGSGVTNGSADSEASADSDTDTADSKSESDSDDTVVLGGAGTAARPVPPAPRLSPDAVAASTSSRTTDPQGMRAVRPRITPPVGTTRVGDGDGEPAPRHFRSASGDEGERRRPTLLMAAAPVLIVVLLILGWAVDSAALSGQVMRNVEVAGRPVGGLGEASLPEVMHEVAHDAAARPVKIVNGDETYETTAGAIGLTVDEEATADAALDAGRKDSVLVRPFKWLGSFFGSRHVRVHYTVSEATAALALAQLQGGNATAPQEPKVQLDPGSLQFVAMPGQVGMGINAQEVAADLPHVAAEDDSGPIVIHADSAPVQPQYTDQAAQDLANQANEMTANGLDLKVEDHTVHVEPGQLRTWITPPTADGDHGFELTADPGRIADELPGLFDDLTEPKDATWRMGANSRPEVVPGQNGIICCNDNSARRIWTAMVEQHGSQPVELDARRAEPEVTTQEAQSWRIAEPVGGNRGWQAGHEIPGPGPGFTTYYTAGEPRVTNIHRVADLVRGAVIPPDGTFSVNDYVGARTTGNGFVEAGAIRNGQHVPEVGGGVSQFATTTFNAAYFAGLDIEEYQSHSEWFQRYPRGREATMGYPSPDLKIHNNTPYGIMIWTSYTDTSVTVTMWSTPYITAEQTGISEAPSQSGPGCTTVTTTRTRTWLDDHHTDTDTFHATYRNQSDIDCHGNPIPPAPEEGTQPQR